MLLKNASPLREATCNEWHPPHTKNKTYFFIPPQPKLVFREAKPSLKTQASNHHTKAAQASLNACLSRDATTPKPTLWEKRSLGMVPICLRSGRAATKLSLASHKAHAKHSWRQRGTHTLQEVWRRLVAQVPSSCWCRDGLCSKFLIFLAVCPVWLEAKRETILIAWVMFGGLGRSSVGERDWERPRSTEGTREELLLLLRCSTAERAARAWCVR